MSDTTKRRTKRLVSLVPTLLVLVILVYAVVTYAPEAMSVLKTGDMNAIKAYIQGTGDGYRAIIILVLLQVLQTVTIFFPGIPVYMVSGIVFGKIEGTIICYLTYVVTNCAVFIFSKQMQRTADDFTGRNETENMVAKLMQKTRHPVKLVMALCFIPVIPNGMIPHFAAASVMNLKEFFRAVATGCIPGIFLFVCCGDLLMTEYFWLVIAMMVLAVALLIATVIFKDKIAALTEKFIKRFMNKDKDQDQA